MIKNLKKIIQFIDTYGMLLISLSYFIIYWWDDIHDTNALIFAMGCLILWRIDTKHNTVINMIINNGEEE